LRLKTRKFSSWYHWLCKINRFWNCQSN